jgi:hypothetical protein
MNRKSNNINDGFIGNSSVAPHLRVVPDLSFFETEENSEIHNLKNELMELKENFLAFLENASHNEGDSTMDIDNLKEKINDIDKKVSILEERTKHLEKIPSRDEMIRLLSESTKEIVEKMDEKLKDKPSIDKTKITVDEILTSKRIPNEQFVETQVTKARNAQILWTIGALSIGVAVIGLFIRFL